MHIAAVLIAVVRHGDKILFLRRSKGRSYYAGKWQMVTGSLDRKEWLEEAALREVEEETGLKGTVSFEGKSFEFVDKELNIRFVIIPFIVDVNSRKVKISDEHDAYEWISPSEYANYDCMPGMEGDLKAVKLI